MRRRLHGVWLGRRAYAVVHELQTRLVEQRQRGEVPDTVLLLEHEPVVTLGRGAALEHVLLSRAALAARGVDLVETARGGDVTLHAPGQLVGYPIVDLNPERRDVRRWVGNLRDCMRSLAADHGVRAGEVPGDQQMIGLWVDELAPGRWDGAARAGRLAKLGAIGVKLSRWVSMHGFAFNLTTDLSLFSLIVPCGISQHGVTSIERLTGERVDVRSAAERALAHLAMELQADVVGLQDAARGDLDRFVPR